MRKSLFVLGAAVAAVGTVVTTAIGGPNGSDNGTMCVQNTQLRPGNEIRTGGPVDSTVESTAKGHAQIKVRNDGTIEYKVFILNKAGEEFFVGHIHEGPVTGTGPPRVFLFGGPPTTARHIRIRDEVDVAPSAAFEASDICTNPSGHYVNFHTTDDPMGAVRGQL